MEGERLERDPEWGGVSVSLVVVHSNHNTFRVPGRNI